MGVLVTGACGIGKSHLAAAAARQLAASGARTASVRATRALGQIGFAAVADLIPAKVDGRDELGVLRETARRLAPDGTSRAVLVVDDAQFLDPGSIAVLQHVARVEAAFLLLTASCEPGTGDRTCGLWHEFGAGRVHLGPLSADAARVVAERRLGGRVSERTNRLLHRHSGGNPLYLHELLGEAQDQGLLEERHGVWTLSALPRPSARLRGAVARSLAGLRDDERRALEFLCLAERLPVAVLNRLAGTDATEDLERRKLVSMGALAGQELELACPLHGPIVRDGLPAARVMALRRELVSELRRADSVPGREYRIAALAGDGTDLGAGELSTAAKQALKRGDTAAATWFATLAAAAGDGALDSALTRARADVAAGRYAAAERLLAAHEAAALAGDEVRTYVDTRLCALLGAGASPGEAERVLGGLRAAAATGAAAHVLDDRLDVLAALREGQCETAALPSDPPLRVIAALAAIERHVASGRIEDALDAADDGLAGLEEALGRRAGEPELALLVTWVHLHVLAAADWNACDRRLVELAAAADENDGLAAAAALGRGQLALARGMSEIACGRLDDAVAGLAEHCPGLRPIALAELARAHALAERPDACAAALGGATGSSVPAQLRFVWATGIALARAWSHAAEGELSAARAALHAELEALRPSALPRVVLLEDLVRLAEDPRMLVAPLRGLAEATGAAYARASATHAGGLAADDAALLGEAATQFAAIGMELVAAEAALQASTRFAAGGYAARSREYLTRSRYALSRCETALTPALMAADTEDAALTEREREIAIIAARGLSNVQIAEHLAISVRTVESHLYRAMNKIGAGRRAQLGELLGVAA